VLDSAAELRRILSSDPGLRNLITLVCVLTGETWGSVDTTVLEHVKRLFALLDFCQRVKRTGALSRSLSRALTRRQARAQQERRDVVREHHHRLVRWLIEQNALVLYPRLATGRLVAKGGPRPRCLNAATARALSAMAHYQLFTHLTSAQRFAPGGAATTLVVGEEFTTRTCGGSCETVAQVGGATTFTCRQPGCGYTAPRDPHAARQIALLAFMRASNRADAAATLPPADPLAGPLSGARTPHGPAGL
jgi:transposase